MLQITAPEGGILHNNLFLSFLEQATSYLARARLGYAHVKHRWGRPADGCHWMGGDEDITWKHHTLPALLIAYIVRSVLKMLQLENPPKITTPVLISEVMRCGPKGRCLADLLSHSHGFDGYSPVARSGSNKAP
jgi:hypothetical protein